MQEHLKTIEGLLTKREIKKAEILIAKHLRVDLVLSERLALLTLRARARLLSARQEDALADLQEIAALSPAQRQSAAFQELYADCRFARFELASVGFADRNDATEARTAYRTIIKAFPDYENLGWVYYQLGRVLLTSNEVNEALHCFQQALLTPSTLSALTAYCYERLGFVAFYEERNLNKAYSFLNRAIDTYPGSEDRAWLVQLHLLRSRVLRDMRQSEAALKAAENAVAIAASAGSENRSSLAEALFTAGELMLELEGRERDAINLLQQFIQISKKPLGVDVTWSRLHEMLGDAHFRQSQYEEAVAAYRSALQFNPYHPWEISLYYRIACSYYQQRDYENAVRAVQRLFETAAQEGQPVSDYRVYDVLGNAHFALGKYDKAVESYQRALEIAPPNAQNIDKIRMYHEFATQRLKQPL
ncbi:MAG: tetratricopeptide repeat protein [Chloroflexi bacterium]|nr:tetratricopeptide repeat protein [Chloroflexota bacterium]